MLDYDPLRVVYDALEREGYQPEGPEYKFRSFCPVHGGDRRSLCVSEGVDGSVVMFCQAHQCAYRDVMKELGLRPGEGFPDGHRNASSQRRERSLTAAESIVEALRSIGISVRETDSEAWWLGAGCPACGSSETLWIKGIGRTRVRLSCWSGCTTQHIQRAIAKRAVYANA